MHQAVELAVTDKYDYGHHYYGYGIPDINIVRDSFLMNDNFLFVYYLIRRYLRYGNMWNFIRWSVMVSVTNVRSSYSTCVHTITINAYVPLIFQSLFCFIFVFFFYSYKYFFIFLFLSSSRQGNTTWCGTTKVFFNKLKVFL